MSSGTWKSFLETPRKKEYTEIFKVSFKIKLKDLLKFKKELKDRYTLYKKDSLM